MHEPGPQSGMRVLVADDDPVSLRFLELALNELGCSVLAVADGAAVVSASAAPFDLMILDRRMPGLGGAELLRALRARGVATPAIATSADLDDATRAELAAAGYHAALAKPLRIAELARDLGAFSAGARGPADVPAAAINPEAQILDDTSALAAVGGDAATLRALRVLLADDLRAFAARTPGLEAPVDELHRLRAACRYCGAVALEQAALGVEATIRNGGSAAQSAWSAFIECCTRTREALAQDAPPR